MHFASAVTIEGPIDSEGLLHAKVEEGSSAHSNARLHNFWPRAAYAITHTDAGTRPNARGHLACANEPHLATAHITKEREGDGLRLTAPSKRQHQLDGRSSCRVRASQLELVVPTHRVISAKCLSLVRWQQLGCDGSAPFDGEGCAAQ
jgi:hypothetical protein